MIVSCLEIADLIQIMHTSHAEIDVLFPSSDCWCFQGNFKLKYWKLKEFELGQVWGLIKCWGSSREGSSCATSLTLVVQPCHPFYYKLSDDAPYSPWPSILLVFLWTFYKTNVAIMVWWTLHDVLLVHHTMAILETTIIDWQQHIQSPIYGDAKKSIQLLSLVDHVAYTLAFSKHSMQSFVVCYKYHGISRVFQKNLLHMLQCLQKVHVVVVVVWNGYVVCILTKLHTFVFFITKRSIVIWFDDYATFNKKKMDNYPCYFFGGAKSYSFLFCICYDTKL